MWTNTLNTDTKITPVPNPINILKKWREDNSSRINDNIKCTFNFYRLDALVLPAEIVLLRRAAFGLPPCASAVDGRVRLS